MKNLIKPLFVLGAYMGLALFHFMNPGHDDTPFWITIVFILGLHVGVELFAARSRRLFSRIKRQDVSFEVKYIDPVRDEATKQEAKAKAGK